MAKNFWQNLKKPFFALAPLDDVSDVVFRQVVVKTFKPDVLFTEFTNVDGLMSRGRDKLLPRFEFKPEQHPIVAQIWGKESENYTAVAEQLVELGFDGIDINMGCPERGICKNGCCSALINNPEKAKEIIDAVKRGAGDLPVSVKTRCGFNNWKTEEWFTFLLQQDLAAITVHGRIAKEMSTFPARWDEIAKVVQLRDQLAPQTVIIGNGDVQNYEDGLQKAKQSGVDGLMIGRGIFHDLWAFAPSDQKPDLTVKDRMDLLLWHARLFNETWGETKNFAILRKFFKIYASGFNGASDLRAKLMETENISQAEQVVQDFLNSN